MLWCLVVLVRRGVLDAVVLAVLVCVSKSCARSRVSLESGTKAFARLRYVAQRWQPCVATLKESSCSKAAELL